MRHPQGFTLLELIVALSIASLLAALALPSMYKARDSLAYQGVLRDMVTDLRAARGKAISQGRDTAFSLDLRDRRFGTGEQLKHELPEAIDITIEVADSEATETGGKIRFYPDGSSTGGSLQVKRKNGAGTHIRVDWLLGSITQSPLDTQP